jgi:hypothetical protein
LRPQGLEGALFRAVHHAPFGYPLMSSVQGLVKRATKRAGVPCEVVKGFSGHAMQIEAAQGIMMAESDSFAIMPTSGWKTQHVLLRYV